MRRVLQDTLIAPTHVTFSPDGRLVFTSTAEKPGQIWYIDSGDMRDMPGSIGAVTSVHFSSDNQFRVTVSRPDWKTKLWDLRAGDLVRDLPGHQSEYGGIGEVTIAQFSPEGNYISTACGFGAGGYLAPVFEGERLLGGLDLNGDGTAEFDGAVRVWKRTGTTFEPLHELHTGTDGVYGLAFDASGKFVIARGRSNAARVYSSNACAPLKDLRTFASDYLEQGSQQH